MSIHRLKLEFLLQDEIKECPRDSSKVYSLQINHTVEKVKLNIMFLDDQNLEKFQNAKHSVAFPINLTRGKFERI